MITKRVNWDLPDSWQLLKSPTLIPVAGINNAWLAVYGRDTSMLTVLIGQHSGIVLNWCYTP